MDFVKITPSKAGMPPFTGINICFRMLRHTKKHPYLTIRIQKEILEAIGASDDDKIGITYYPNDTRKWILIKDDEGHKLNIVSRHAVQITFPWKIFKPLKSEFKTRKINYEIKDDAILIDASLPEALQESGEKE